MPGTTLPGDPSGPGKPQHWSGAWLIVAIPVVVLAILVPLLLLAPPRIHLSYELTPGQFVVRYGAGGPVLERSDILSVQVLSPGKGTRLAGASLRGQYVGYWSFPGIGRVWLYCTSLSSVVVIRTSDRAIGISPGDPAAFKAALESGGTGIFAAAADHTTGKSVAWLIELASALIIIAGILFGFRRIMMKRQEP